MFGYERNISLPYKTEKGVPPKAAVERIMPSSLVNYNTQGESAIALYMVFWSNGKTPPFKGGDLGSTPIETKLFRRIQQLICFDMLEEKHTV